jgi:hypothetical protein
LFVRISGFSFKADFTYFAVVEKAVLEVGGFVFIGNALLKK